MFPSTRITRVAAACVLLPALLVSGCGGGGSSSGSSNPPPTAAASLALLTGTPGGYGYFDGIGSAAQFRSPYGLAVDRSENVYVADAGNGVIRRITPQGVTTTLAGAERQNGFVDGPAAQARFGFGIGGNFGPLGVATDVSGNVYVADTLNHSVRKISPIGIVITLAGDGQSGSADGQGAGARFYLPSALAVDASGFVYVADSGNHTIRRIAADGKVTTVAGRAGTVGDTDGPALEARFTSPHSIAVAPSGDIYVAAQQAIRKLTPAGQVTTFIPPPTAGRQDSASVLAPQAIATDALGNLYATDAASGSVQKITPAGVVTTLAGQKGFECPRNGPADVARFWSVQGIAVAPSGTVYVAEDTLAVIRAISPSREVTTLAGGERGCAPVDGTLDAARFTGVSDIAADANGKLYIVDSGARRVRTISNGEVATLGIGPGPVYYMALASSGVLYAIGYEYPGICRTGCVWKPYGTLSRIAPGGATSAITPTSSSDFTGTELAAAGGLAIDATGNLYWSDPDNQTIRKLTPAGDLTTLAGTKGFIGSGDGKGPTARFNRPSGLVLDGAGNLYLADRENHTIRKITPDGTATTFAGLPGEAGSVDGPRGTARFNTPWGLALDGAGNLYVADTGNCLVRKIAVSGAVTTVAGSLHQCGFAPGALPGALEPPGRLAVSGNDLYVAMSYGVAVIRNRP